ncbi:C40 family peptidase [Quadrisphaera sp. INWT6]|uniref:C40 family peptidase n=1 Tax=Quadrisphaera sp. INWT6 TaxID=2596917 RepID=UPI001892056E|nr:NlpC/P60 family protein [Quadrisphaera sp. INWT6]MBF5082754.1 NlpC/P60 family protein [Quadrisphaera sp. INWT6]
MSIFHARKPFLRVAAGLALSGGLLAAAAVPANAAGVVNSAAVLATADDYLGTPYRFGGTTPAGFDCSGYTQHVFAQNGVSIPRTADAQMDASTRISASSAQPGDLVFFVRNGRAYHVGIYTGDGRMMDSPRSGKTVTERSIWGSNVVYGRF